MAKDESSVGDMAETPTGEILLRLAHIQEAQEELKRVQKEAQEESKAGHRETNAHLRELNGRMNKAETKIAVIESNIERRSRPSAPSQTRVRDMGKGKLTAAIVAALFGLAGAMEATKAVLAAVKEALVK